MYLKKFKFMRNPDDGYFLAITMPHYGIQENYGPAYEQAMAILKLVADSRGSYAELFDRRIPELENVCIAVEIVESKIEGEKSGQLVVMQDGRIIECERQPDGSYESVDEIIEREWSAAEIRRAAQGGV